MIKRKREIERYRNREREIERERGREIEMWADKWLRSAAPQLHSLGRLPFEACAAERACCRLRCTIAAQ